MTVAVPAPMTVTAPPPARASLRSTPVLTGLFPPGPANNLRTPTMPVTNTDEDTKLPELDPVIHAQPRLRLTVALAALPEGGGTSSQFPHTTGTPSPAGPTNIL